MADVRKKVSQLPAATTLIGPEMFEIVQDGQSKSATVGLIGGGLYALIHTPNVFTTENTFSGFRLAPTIVTASRDLEPDESALFVDATDANIVLNLPPSSGDGQFYNLTRIDATGNTITVLAAGSDLIGGANSVSLPTQYSNVGLIDASPGQWYVLFTGTASAGSLSVSRVAVNDDYMVLPTDFEIIADATNGSFTITLPVADTGQVLHVKKVDTTTNVVTVQAQDLDLIDGSVSVNLTNQYSDCLLISSQPNYWDNVGGASIEVPLVKHLINCTATGSPITTGKIAGYFTCPYDGVITGYSIMADSGTATIKVWKVASGSAVPTSGDSISTAGISLATGTAIQSFDTSDFTSTDVTENDIFAFNIEAISGPTELAIALEITID